MDWINSKERLPKQYEKVIALLRLRNGGYGITDVTFFDSDVKNGAWMFCPGCEVSYWAKRVLPEGLE